MKIQMTGGNLKSVISRDTTEDHDGIGGDSFSECLFYLWTYMVSTTSALNLW